MTQFHGGLLPETTRDVFSNETGRSLHQPSSLSDGFEVSASIDDEHNLESEWIDIGGEG